MHFALLELIVLYVLPLASKYQTQNNILNNLYGVPDKRRDLRIKNKTSEVN